MKAATTEWGKWKQEWGVFCLIAIVVLPLFTPRLYASDEIKYFVPLRSLYFDHDLHYANEYAYFISKDPVAQAGLRPYLDEVTVTGHRLNDAPIGSAVLWAPFYIAADTAVVVARVFGSDVQRDGYSWPYVFAVSLGSLVWGMAGLCLIYRLCRYYAGRKASRLAVLAIWFASPVVFYLYITPPMAHANSMFAVALYLLVWRSTRQRRRVSSWGLLGIVAGLMILVRELNWLFLLVVIFDELSIAYLSWRGRRNGQVPDGSLGVEYRQRWLGYLAFAVALSVVVAPQFVVYRTLHGTFGPAPFVVDKFQTIPLYAGAVLFSGFHGLFSWHPVTLFGILGLPLLWRREPIVAGALALVFIAQVAVIGSYETWWGGASFGARRFINCAPIFAVGLAMALSGLRLVWVRFASVGLAFLVVWNIGLAMQYSTGLIPRDQPVSVAEITYNQIFVVPPRLAGVAWRFVFDRSSFYRTRS